MSRIHPRQRGVTLFIGLVFLIILTLMGLAAFRVGKSNFMTTANMQQHVESVRAAEQVLDEIISNVAIDLTQDKIFEGSDQRAVDINGDGKADVTVKVAAKPVCKKIETIPVATLDLSNANDLACSTGVDSSSAGIGGAATGASLCSDVIWEITASAEQAYSSAKVVVVSGIGQRISTNKSATICN
jgi:Tfp pilus assembly protein PilX